MDRREMLKNLAILPVGGGLMSMSPLMASPDKNVAKGPLALDKDIYKSIGVVPIINCRGTFTIIGGSIERPEVHAAMAAASKNFVQYDELAFAIGERLSEITKAEFGIVTAGCAAAMKHGTAACVTGGNPEKLLRIPDLSGLDKTEVIIPRHSRNVYDHAVRNIGITVVEVDSMEALEKAINPKTAMIYLLANRSSATGQPMSVEAIAKVAKKQNIPIMVDAAAENLSIPVVHFERGADMVAYSGGKAMCGPQCAGLLLGRKDLMLSAWQASSPHHGPGRDNKVGKEEMLGMLAAVEAWTTRDHEKEWDRWMDWLNLIADKATKIKGVSYKINLPEGLNNRAPNLVISWDPAQFNITGAEVAELFGRSEPRIAIGSGGKDGVTSINVTPSQMQDGEAKVVANRLYDTLSEKRPAPDTSLAAPSGNIAGRWDINMSFFSSESTHHMILEQDGNWLNGTHKSDFAEQDVYGTIEGDTIKIRSHFRKPGDSVVYMFTGKLKNGEWSGEVFMGEYLTANFTAKKWESKKRKQQITVPGGPPLAT
ncbi:MAG: aminotransferase class V-fold PLP-dependent enzyme [Cytophagales bacterium]|uniref:aminotransferase class V-fold PLP-dependent enzyme n=1 Tax=Cyclobacterium marinum TaxID=104 RepID=UPI0011EE19B3|nr:aminotransferase class V-fold PLP-dependent enzyme [Cyclobacterium marinum]MBI0401156.1 aminotransferase class V-fold PLP-dependent enzyme [Cyclobacterium marinum]MBR9776887.1 aminotransferase class V-fold PLP-dependent enzyme [Cytophagales bacterium]|tara:strand:+ start:89119 stop:90738 length:1620 start_codon:yes stop_codon:yes gene_type:complete